ncbi:hypothetical protein [Thermococcus barophilus]|uniref:Uncharacterized protein n=1 Tax=Thermococcus barophilus TaxID=55802 RepID=A0A0S1XC71_THEBA|nr:hypothetical protein [Thermococcus barophilus]ALM75340.1 conserved exported hypothetical protein [Thermococcus barophilus]
MDILTVVIVVVAVLIGTIVSAWITSNMLSTHMEEMYSLLRTQAFSAKPEVKPEKRTEAIAEKIHQEPQKQETIKASDEEIIKKLREMIDQKVKNVIEEAKKKKERLLMLLDVARGYTLGYISEDEYNAFLMKVLSELEEFKRLWLARFPSVSEKEKLNTMINYIAKTKLPIEVRAKNTKEVIRLSPEEALIKITSSINNAISILDELIKSKGENPAVTPLEIKLSKEVEKLKKKVEQLERQLEEFSMS